MIYDVLHIPGIPFPVLSFFSWRWQSEDHLSWSKEKVATEAPNMKTNLGFNLTIIRDKTKGKVD